MQQKFYLGSSSPRRQELLTQLNIEFEKLLPDIDETQHHNETPYDYVVRMALEKAQAAEQKRDADKTKPYRPIIAADTTVVSMINGIEKILAKPLNKQDGISMLKVLSGKTHIVYSAVCLLHKTEFSKEGEDIIKTPISVSTTKVTFASINENDIEAYWSSQEPLGKAGGYAIQGLGAQFIEKIEGSYTGVVGLPLYELKQLIVQNL